MKIYLNRNELVFTETERCQSTNNSQFHSDTFKYGGHLLFSFSLLFSQHHLWFHCFTKIINKKSARWTSFGHMKQYKECNHKRFEDKKLWHHWMWKDMPSFDYSLIFDFVHLRRFNDILWQLVQILWIYKTAISCLYLSRFEIYFEHIALS